MFSSLFEFFFPKENNIDNVKQQRSNSNNNTNIGIMFKLSDSNNNNNNNDNDKENNRRLSIFDNDNNNNNHNHNRSYDNDYDIQNMIIQFCYDNTTYGYYNTYCDYCCANDTIVLLSCIEVSNDNDDNNNTTTTSTNDKNNNENNKDDIDHNNNDNNITNNIDNHKRNEMMIKRPILYQSLDELDNIRKEQSVIRIYQCHHCLLCYYCSYQCYYHSKHYKYCTTPQWLKIKDIQTETKANNDNDYRSNTIIDSNKEVDSSDEKTVITTTFRNEIEIIVENEEQHNILTEEGKQQQEQDIKEIVVAVVENILREVDEQEQHDDQNILYEELVVELQHNKEHYNHEKQQQQQKEVTVELNGELVQEHQDQNLHKHQQRLKDDVADEQEEEHKTDSVVQQKQEQQEQQKVTLQHGIEEHIVQEEGEHDLDNGMQKQQQVHAEQENLLLSKELQNKQEHEEMNEEDIRKHEATIVKQVQQINSQIVAVEDIVHNNNQQEEKEEQEQHQQQQQQEYETQQNNDEETTSVGQDEELVQTKQEEQNKEEQEEDSQQVIEMEVGHDLVQQQQYNLENMKKENNEEDVINIEDRKVETVEEVEQSIEAAKGTTGKILDVIVDDLTPNTETITDYVSVYSSTDKNDHDDNMVESKDIKNEMETIVANLAMSVDDPKNEDEVVANHTEDTSINHYATEMDPSGIDEQHPHEVSEMRKQQQESGETYATHALNDIVNDNNQLSDGTRMESNRLSKTPKTAVQKSKINVNAMKSPTTVKRKVINSLADVAKFSTVNWKLPNVSIMGESIDDVKLRHAEEQERKEYNWDKPEWTDVSPNRNLAAIEQLESKILSSDFTPLEIEEIQLRHTEQNEKTNIEWERPEWAQQSPLRSTTKQKVLSSPGIVTSPNNKSSIGRPKPEWTDLSTSRNLAAIEELESKRSTNTDRDLTPLELEEIQLRHTEQNEKTNIEWEKPDWAQRSQLRSTTESSTFLSPGPNKPSIGWEIPEWASKGKQLLRKTNKLVTDDDNNDMDTK